VTSPKAASEPEAVLIEDAFAHCERLVRAADRDRFLTTLFAPAKHRGAFAALYAFNLEIARVREVVQQPAAGEIRLQWWSDVLDGAGRGETAAHPVAAALLATIARYRLPPERLKALIEARRFDLYDEPMRTLDDLEAYGQSASAGPIALAAHILAGGTDIDALSRHAGLAHADRNPGAARSRARAGHGRTGDAAVAGSAGRIASACAPTFARSAAIARRRARRRVARAAAGGACRAHARSHGTARLRSVCAD
jgi:hypothetical protein